jgi:glycosyltransferase involved in cell wall biosynthesis
VGGVSFILKHEQNGLLVEANSVAALSDALISAVNDRQKFIDMGLTGRQMVEKNFSVESMTEAYFALYEHK